MTSYSLNDYPAGIAANIVPDQYNTVLDLFEQSVKKYASNKHASCMGASLTYAQLDQKSAEFASYLQNHTLLKPGDRIAIQLPNILQFSVVAFGALRAGMVLVNTNPLYTEPELLHQFRDSGAKALVVYAGMAKTALSVINETAIEHVVVTELADFHPPVKRILLNTVVKYVKKMVPSYDQHRTVPLLEALKLGALQPYERVGGHSEDTVVLQYTGGTTGVSKGAMLSNRNLIANMLQSLEFFNVELEAERSDYHVAALSYLCIYY